MKHVTRAISEMGHHDNNIIPGEGYITMDSLFFLEVVLTVSIAAVMSLITYVHLSRLFLSMRITKMQFLKTLPAALILPAIIIMSYILLNPQNLNIAEPLTYAWGLIFWAVFEFLVTCRTYFLHFGKKNLGNTRRERSGGSTI